MTGSVTRTGLPASALVRRFLGREDGAAYVEFAIVLPLLALLLSGIVLFGSMQVERLGAERAATSLTGLALLAEREGVTPEAAAEVLAGAWERTAWPRGHAYRVLIRIFTVTDGALTPVWSAEIGAMEPSGGGDLGLREGALRISEPISLAEGERLIAVEAWKAYGAIRLPWGPSPAPFYTYRVLHR